MPAPYAARSGALIDALFTGAMRKLQSAGGTEFVATYGGAERIGGLIDFRVPLRAGAISAGGYAAVRRYVAPADRAAHLAAMAAGGGVTVRPDGSFIATAVGLAFLADLTGWQQRILAGWWAAHPLDLVVTLAAELLLAARPTGGAAFAAMAPDPMPAGPGLAVTVLNLVGTLRYHRADAHAAAWAAAGLDAPAVQAMPPGPARDAIEARTNELAAPPYAGWTQGRRSEWLDLLTALTRATEAA